MKRKRMLSAAALALWTVAPLMIPLLAAQTVSLSREPRIVVSGQVSIINGADGNWLVCPGISVRRGTTPLTGLDVRLEKVRLTETVPGYYAERIASITPSAGKTLRLTIDSAAAIALPHALTPAKIAIAGTAVVSSLAVITQPASGSSLSAAELAAGLQVCWSGGVAPFTIGLMKPSGSAVLSIFEQAGLPGHCYTLPGTLMPAGLTYTVIVMYKMEPFVLQSLGKEFPAILDKASSITLGGSDIVTVAVH